MVRHLRPSGTWRRARFVAVALLCCAVVAIADGKAQAQAQDQPAHPESEPCTLPRRTVSHVELAQILAQHRRWVESEHREGSRANLCNVRLRAANVIDELLFDANLSGANLSGANLSGVYLFWADFSGANLVGANLSGAMLSGAMLNGANLGGANLSSADLSGANLSRANLNGANLRGARLVLANLSSALLGHPVPSLLLSRSIRASQAFRALGLSPRHNPSPSDFTGADLSGADLSGADLSNARLSHVILSNAVYQTPTAPNVGYLSGMAGVQTLRFRQGQEIGLVLLRNALQQVGLRELEREATFAIENGRVLHALCDWHDQYGIDQPFGLFEECRLNLNPLAVADGLFRMAAFGATTRYGLEPGRALLIIVILWGALVPVYIVSIWRQPWPRSRAGGIYRIVPADRIEIRQLRPKIDNQAKAERLHHRNWKALGYAAYFSLLSAFNIGFRELNVGTWITRLQSREYSLRAVGWVRVVSGIQSLLSVYLLALWVLTYFGRPFQ